MKIHEQFLGQMEREAAISRRVLARVPGGKPSWKPHPKSMELGYLATLVATIPNWIQMMIERDELDLDPPGGKPHRAPEWTTSQEVVALHDRMVEGALAALRATSDDHLMTHWRLLVGGNVVADAERQAAIGDTFTHLAHHRGQLTVYLRLNEVPVPSIYGPSADDRTF